MRAASVNWIAPVTGQLKLRLYSRFTSQEFIYLMASENRDDLAMLRELVEAEKVTPVIDRTYQLSEAPEAIRYLETWHARGKVVVTA